MAALNFDPKAEKYREADQRLTAAYRRVEGAPVPIATYALGAPGMHSYKESLLDLDKMLENAILYANVLAALDLDMSPFISTHDTVVMVPEAFGCEIIIPDVGTPWAKHLVQDISKVWELKPVGVGESPRIRQMFDWVDLAQRKLGTDLPIWTLDIQSPFSVAAQIVEPEELMMACYSEPEAVHHVCRMVTDFTIEFMQKHIAQMEHPCFPGRCFPSVSENVGVVIADDTPLIMLSPEMYEEFALPYNCQIGEAFGGANIHCCGDYRHNLHNLMKITNVRSIQLHAGPGEFQLPETREEDCVFNSVRDRLSMFVDTNEVSRGDEYKGKYREFYENYVLPRLSAGGLTGCIIEACMTPGASLEVINDNINWTRELVARFGAGSL